MKITFKSKEEQKRPNTCGFKWCHRDRHSKLYGTTKNQILIPVPVIKNEEVYG